MHEWTRKVRKELKALLLNTVKIKSLFINDSIWFLNELSWIAIQELLNNKDDEKLHSQYYDLISAVDIKSLISLRYKINIALHYGHQISQSCGIVG
jgi:hypothetical protein